MIKAGIIGCGSTGHLLVNGFVSSKVFRPDEIMVSFSNAAPIGSFSRNWPGLSFTNDNREVVRNGRLVFICVEPLDVLPVLDEIKGSLKPECHVVSTANSVGIVEMEKFFEGKITRIIPSPTSEVKEGFSLVCHNARVGRADADRIERLFQPFGIIVAIDENEFEAAANLTSRAPVMIAAIFQNLVEAGLRHSRLSSDIAQQMVSAALFGTAKMIIQNKMDFSEMISKIFAGEEIAEEVVKVLNNGLPDTFDFVFNQTLNRHSIVERLVKSQLPGLSANPTPRHPEEKEGPVRAHRA